MLPVRLVSGVSIATLLLLGIIFLPTKVLLYISSLIICLSSLEFFRLRFSLFWSILFSTTLLLLFIFNPFNLAINHLFLFIGIPLWIFMGILVLSFPHNKDILQQGFFWVTIGFLLHIIFWSSIVLILSAQGFNLELFGLNLSERSSLIFFISIGALMDTFSYFGGKKMGRNKFLPNVSPSKTIEGFFLGLFLTPICLVIGLSFFQNLNYFSLSLFIILVCLFATIGDASASLFKRISGVKDFSNLIPGHGGILDRIDSHLASLPISLCIIYILNKII